MVKCILGKICTASKLRKKLLKESLFTVDMNEVCETLALSYWIEDYRDYEYALQVLKCCGYGILGIMIN